MWLVLALLVLVLAFLAFGPREPAVTDVPFEESRLGADVDGYLADREAAFDDITEGVEKKVLWASAAGAQTDWAVLYVHGFSATSEEIRPVPDRVAQGLGANLVFTRLTGHGRSGAAMGEATVEAWMSDVTEALAVARRVGRRVLVISTSTGCTLVTLALNEAVKRSLGAAGGGAEAVAGTIFVAPNYRLKDPSAWVLTLPLARLIVPLVVGKERGFTPRNAAHGRFWTSRYDSRAMVVMAAAVRAVNRLDFGRMRVPALFVFDDRDVLVDHARTREIARRWGARGGVSGEVFAVDLGPDDDPGHHVIAGEILSPGMTDAVAAKMLDWARTLPVSDRSGA